MKKNDKNNLIRELRRVFLIMLPSVIVGIRIAIVEKPKGILLIIVLIITFFLIFIYARELIRIYKKYKKFQKNII
jgi:hypothetical protein